ncbi:MAG TPA: hypothetical protein VHB20_03610 [Verrucomicrobiae bacterium]|jgi:hypothetical protein|nr:hypothetical protein [Verrucomicrobiae bacterium]
MKALTPAFHVQQIQGFAIHVLRSEEMELAVAPELGAKIISLKNLRTQREWLWHPQGPLKLFKNQPHDEFSASPLVGMDECLPTIAACAWRERPLPDHGELWNRSWTVDAAAWQNGVLTTRMKLKCSPLVFERTIELRGQEAVMDYTLNNLSSSTEQYIWALHPLLRLMEGDALELPESTRARLPSATWLDDLSASPARNCAKIFARPVVDAWAAVKNEAQGDRLEFAWDAKDHNTLGLWLTRGGWHGHHHFAIEPTNADDDSLAVAAARGACGSIAARSSAQWRISLRVGL